MKFEYNAKYTTIAVYAVLVIAASMICFQLLGHIDILVGYIGTGIGYVMPVVYGAVFAFLLNPLMRNIDNKLLPRLFGRRPLRPKAKRAVSIALTYLIAVLAIATFIAIVLPQLINSMASIWNNVPSYFKTFNKWYQGVLEYIGKYSVESGTEISNVLADLAKRLNATAVDMLYGMYEMLAQSLGTVVTAATNFTTKVVNLLLGIIVSIYILFDKEKLFAQLNKIGVAVLPKAVYRLFYDIAMDINRIFSGFVFGKVIDSLIIGILCMIGTSILKMPYAVLISVIIGVTNIIPYFGPFIGAVPGILIILIVDPIKAVWFTIFILLLQQLDGNVIGPKILGDTVGLSPLWIIFSIMLFSGLLGVLGMFIGVPLFAILYVLIKRFVTYLLKRKGEPTDTRSYQSKTNQML